MPVDAPFEKLKKFFTVEGARENDREEFVGNVFEMYRPPLPLDIRVQGEEEQAALTFAAKTAAGKCIVPSNRCRSFPTPFAPCTATQAPGTRTTRLRSQVRESLVRRPAVGHRRRTAVAK